MKRPRTFIDEQARKQAELDACVRLFGPPVPEDKRVPRGARTVYAVHRDEVEAEEDRLASAADRVLAALQTGPKTNLDLIDICQRISGRIYDLRRRGHTIDTDLIEPGVYRYTLRSSHQGETHAEEV